MWRSLVLRDGTMVTGDSGGNVQFWDAQLGTRTAAFQARTQPLWRKPSPKAAHPASPAASPAAAAEAGTPQRPQPLQQQMQHGVGTLRSPLHRGGPSCSVFCMRNTVKLCKHMMELTLQVHAADILAMAASPAGDAVFAAGIDPQLALYKRVPGNKGLCA